jgi:hypothetical protein
VIVLLAVLALAVWAVPATIVVVARDGYRAVPTRPWYDYESSRSA